MLTCSCEKVYISKNVMTETTRLLGALRMEWDGGVGCAGSGGQMLMSQHAARPFVGSGLYVIENKTEKEQKNPKKGKREETSTS